MISEWFHALIKSRIIDGEVALRYSFLDDAVYG